MFIKDLQIITIDYESENSKNFKLILNYKSIIEHLSENLASWLIFHNKNIIIYLFILAIFFRDCLK